MTKHRQDELRIVLFLHQQTWNADNPFPSRPRSASVSDSSLLCTNLVTSTRLRTRYVTTSAYQGVLLLRLASYFSARTSQLASIAVPDVDPSQLPAGADFSMAAGDFMEVYTDTAAWDCVCSCFFLDTAANIVAYIEVHLNKCKLDLSHRAPPLCEPSLPFALL